MRRKLVSLAMTLCLLIAGIGIGFHPVLAESATKTEKQEAKEQLNQLKELVSQGKLPSCEFPLGTHINTIVEKWGKPAEEITHKNVIGAAAYPDKGFIFFADRYGVLWNIQLSRTEVGETLNVTLSEIKQALGEPNLNNTEDYAGYLFGDYCLQVGHGHIEPGIVDSLSLMKRPTQW